MRTFGTTEITKRLQSESLSLFTLDDLKRIFKIANKNTLYKKVQRLEKQGLVKRLIKGKYLFLFQKPHDFLVANFLYRPSYISLESALSFYGMIAGFPYKITSISAKKSRRIVVEGKEYLYSQIKKDLFWGYEKKENFLIADKEKALLDYFYFAFKGLREIDLSEFDLTLIENKKFNQYLKRISDKKFRSFVDRTKR